LNAYILLHISGICLLLLCSFFFSGSETALFSLSSLKIKHLQKEKGHKGVLIARLLANPRGLLISILLGNIFVNILSSTLADSLIRSVIPGGRGTLLAIITMTFAILVIGEITPKTIAIQYAERVSLLVAPVISAIDKLVRPVRRVFRAVSDAVITAVSGHIPIADHHITEEEIKTAIGVGVREGVVDSQEKEMIHGVLSFADKNVNDIMRPRQEITAFEINDSLANIEDVIRKHEYSRLPVYDEEFDNITGILYAKDLLRALRESKETEIRSMLRPAYFVPENKPALSLFREFRKKRIHMAIVVDEYGGVSGLITLEDMIEEIIGEIRDKDDTEPMHKELSPGVYRIKARLEIEEFNNLLGVDIADENNVTIGGFLISRIGSIPPVGFSHKYGGLLFTVSQAERNRVDELIVKKISPGDKIKTGDST
jgi:putative hemolysin